MCVSGIQQAVAFYPGGKEADRLKQIVLVEMALYIYVNIPRKPHHYRLTSAAPTDLLILFLCNSA